MKLKLAQQVTLLRTEIRVLFMSGHTDNAIVHHGVLDEPERARATGTHGFGWWAVDGQTGN